MGKSYFFGKSIVPGTTQASLSTSRKFSISRMASQARRKSPQTKIVARLGIQLSSRIDIAQTTSLPNSSDLLSPSIIPRLRILNRPLPIRPHQKPALRRRHQTQCNRNPRPQPLQLPPQPKRRAERNRHRDHIVAD